MINSCRAIAFALLACSTAAAQPAAQPAEQLTRWQWYQEIKLPDAPKSGAFQFLLGPEILDAARPDLHDLRLFDATGREVPFALRIREARNEERAYTAREFNQVKLPDRSVEVSLDLGEATHQHNRIAVNTGGVNYRRWLSLDGSDNGKDWKPIVQRKPLTSIVHEGAVFDAKQISYPVSQFRYLRVHVAPDPAIEDDAPAAPQVRLMFRVHIDGLEYPRPAELSARSPVRESVGGDYASEWFIALSGKLNVPWHRLEFDAEEAEFARSYRIEDVSVADRPRVLLAGEWQRTAGKRESLQIQFNPETTARGFRLVIIDQRNPALTVRLKSASAFARQLIFERPAEGPVRLYFGNPDAAAPGYDYARSLPDKLDVEPAKVTPGEVATNPTYQPPRVPLTERSPATTYVVFGLVAVILLGILGMLARRAIAAHDAIAPPTQESPAT
jgi:hypothetical protein